MPKILYVEDEPDIAELVRRRLEEDDEHRMIHARDGESGLALALSELPDLILMDLNLPEKDAGFDVNRRLKAGQATRSIPVIALTANVQWSEVRERTVAEGFVGHVSKPIDFDRLLSLVEVYAGRGGGT